PEGISFTYELAGPVLRLYSLLLDGLCIYGLYYFANRFTTALDLIWRDVGTAVQFLVFFLVMWGYYIATEWYLQGQSVGKKILGLRVMDAQGFKLRLEQVVLRNLMRAVDALPVAYLLGGIVSFFSPRRQRLGDMLAGTVVVREARRARPDVSALLGDRYNSFLDHPHLVYMARSRIVPEEAGLLLGAVLSRDDLDPAARLAVFASLAAHFKSRVPFPDDALSDERYLRNFADVVFNRN
ncbi:MAG: hypothetical protein A3I06_00580, partial [Candidatus Lindowbacteria bacterium RIFCSPLOWO2_02_FULL_62_12]